MVSKVSLTFQTRFSPSSTQHVSPKCDKPARIDPKLHCLVCGLIIVHWLGPPFRFGGGVSFYPLSVTNQTTKLMVQTRRTCPIEVYNLKEDLFHSRVNSPMGHNKRPGGVTTRPYCEAPPTPWGSTSLNQATTQIAP